jgi:PAS domain S-box-containing protein
VSLHLAGAEGRPARTDRPDGGPRRGSRGRRTWLRADVPVHLVLALVLTLATGLAVVSYTRMLTTMTERQMQNTADLAQVFLNQQNAATAAVISSVTEAADVNEALQEPDSPRSRAVVENVLKILLAGNPDSVTVLITDARGRVLGDRPAVVPVGYDLSARPWYRQARQGNGFVVSPVFTSVITGQNLTTISVPVRAGGDPDGEFLGVVAIGRSLPRYQEFVDAYQRNRGVRLTVVDGAGAVVADGGHAVGEATPVAQRIAAGRQISAPRPGWIVAGGATSPGAWGVISQETSARALRPAMIFRAVAVSAAAGILLAFLAFRLLRRKAARARRDAARHLEQSRSRMRDLADSSPDVVFQLTGSGSVIFVSRAAETVLGRTPESLAGADLMALLEAENPPDAGTRLRRLRADGEPSLFTARAAGPGGRPRVVECSLRLGRTEDEIEVWGALHDVTERRTAADQITALFELSGDFMAVIDYDGRLVQVNPVWSAAFDISSSRLVATPFAERFSSADRQVVETGLGELAADSSNRSMATFETHYERDGSTRTLFWTVAPDPVRRLVYAVGRDITEHKELARALAEARDQALETSRLKSEFVATMSHEIRTPMNGVIGLTDLLLDTRLDATQRRYVEGVRTAGEALLSVINDILDFSKIDVGRLLLDSVDFRLEDVVDDVVTLVRQAAAAKSLELVVEYRPGVPFALNGDPGRLRQILLNLAYNAVKFTAEGGVTVRVEPGAPRDDEQVAVAFVVTDTGIGIEPARLDDIFEPFRQVDEGSTRAYGGTGLGLSICRRLAALMGGTITVASVAGEGSTFSAELVFRPAADWGRAVRGRDARGLAVLVVDDDEVNRLVMTTQLNRWGMRPVAAASASEAMELLTEREAPAGGYDLAVVDMHMPGTDGMDLVRQVRAVPALAGLPVIMLTSDRGVPDSSALEHGISARLTKPVQQSELFDALTRVGVPNTPAAGATADPAPHAAGPAVRGTAHSTHSAHAAQPAHVAHSTHSAADESGFHLLLVEDNDINQTVALGILSQLGYRVDVAGDGLQALTMAGQRAYDAILMDCQMPRMDGYTATVELRKRPATSETPIIAMTAATFAADRQRCFDSGMDDFIAKPVRAATLQATLNRWLQAGPARPPALAGAGAGAAGIGAVGAVGASVAARGEVGGHVRAVREQVAAAHEAIPPGPAAPGAPGRAPRHPVPAADAATPRPAGRPVPAVDAGSPGPTGLFDVDEVDEVVAHMESKPRSGPAETLEAPGAPVPRPRAGRAGEDEPGGTPDGAAEEAVEMAGTDERIAELLGDGSDLEVELVREIVASFLDRTVDLLQRLTLAVAAEDAEATYLHAHSLAGAGLNLGTVEVVRICRTIERDAKAGRPGLGAPRLVELEVALDQARVRLRDLAAGLPDPSPRP